MTKTEKQLIAHLLHRRIEELEKESASIQRNDMIDPFYRDALYAFIQKELTKIRAIFIKWSK